MSKYDDNIDAEFKRLITSIANQYGYTAGEYMAAATDQEISDWRLMAKAAVDERYAMQAKAAASAGQAAAAASTAASAAGESQEKAQAFDMATNATIGSLINTIRAGQAEKNAASPIKWLWPAVGIAGAGFVVYALLKRGKK